MNKEQLKSGIIRGSSKAIACCYERYNKRAYYYLLKRTRNHHDAEDLVQETFIRIMRYGYTLHYWQTSLSAWIYQNCMQCLHKRYEKQSAQMRTGIEISKDEDRQGWKPMQIPSDDPTPEQQASDRMLMESVRTKLRKINSDYAIAVDLRDLQQFSYEEVASILDINLNTVKTRIHRGRNEIKN